jgi:sugar phosphate isomerase/epimerase
VKENHQQINRRQFCEKVFTGVAIASFSSGALPDNRQNFRFKYIVASSLYGRMKLADILPEVRKTGAEHIDIWSEPHANHREQVEALGHEQFLSLLKEHNLKLGILTRYDLGPFGIENEIHLARKLGGSMVICGSRGPNNLRGQALRAAIKEFGEKMKPYISAAEQAGIIIGLENHSASLIESAESIKWLVELVPSSHLGVALAPYHLPQDPSVIANLITNIGNRLVHFYAWQYGMGCQKKLPKEQELLQLPGRGNLDFVSIVAALKKVNYKSWVEIFMHPVPRGEPILATATEITAEIERCRQYLECCLDKVL